MTREVKISDRQTIIVIEPEPDGKCELCGKVDELRPYGPNRENICYDCGMKHEEIVNRHIEKRFKDPKMIITEPQSSHN